MPLILKKVTIQGSFKAYGYRDGISGGTEITEEYEVPEDDLKGNFLKREILTKKHLIDKRCMLAEYMKGTIPEEIYTSMVSRLDRMYQDLLQGGKNEQAT